MQTFRDFPITRRADGSYVITHNGYPYHVVNDEEMASFWSEVNAYAQEHPDQTTDEPAPPQPTEAELLERAKTAKLYEINAAYEAATSSIVETYPKTELLTFDKQEAEARSYNDDPTATTPLVDALAAGRTMDKAELVRRIIAKADAFSVAVGYYTGQRQKYEDMVKAAETAEDIQAIVPEYALPDMIQGAPDATEQPAEDPTTEPTPDLETAPETPEPEKPADTEATA